MNIARNIAKNTVVLLISQIVTYVLAFLYTIYLARYLGVEGFGTLSFALAFTGLFSVIGDLGLSTLTTREVSRNKSLVGKYLINVTTIKIMLTILMFLLIVVLLNVLGYPDQIIYFTCVISVSYILANFSSLFTAFFQAFVKMEYQALSQILLSVSLLSGVIFSINQNYGIMAFAFVYLIAYLIQFLFLFFTFLFKFKISKSNVDLTFWKDLLIKALPLSLALIFSTISFRVDAVLLSYLANNSAVGLYSAAYKLMEALIFIPTIFATVVLPVFASFYVSSKDSLKIAYGKSFKYLSIIGFPIAMGVMMLANEIILFIYNSEFTQSEIVLKIVIWAIPFIFLSYLLKIFLISTDKQNLLFKIVLMTMTLNVILNLIVIPIYSFIGASVVTVITEFLTFLLCFYFISVNVYKIPIKNYMLKPLFASAIMALFISIVKIDLFLTIFSSILIYFLTLVLIKTFSEDDLILVKQVFKL
ncbi:MAG: colanic acid exporter [Candidatus Methanofastidiosum methylothiophilum]|uniref:Colanic acid exporter n=1 Tax=Candidatus Methanofastidiosum methylothiophilum TaxID=1705564 RepID=A0A150IKP8_9EURY|nr:MAG: colanic acid exporter [Candidatus Methanofastidiosum methylthiophilus]KYC46930.1 MAG: colanic acid exporter [Candidatus Methanofastidiosum methylthiophilus]KYC49056.1 MAG: colanic acid exporter [Candidatus Methanofastidiosum methylthiophilus]